MFMPSCSSKMLKFFVNNVTNYALKLILSVLNYLSAQIIPLKMLDLSKCRGVWCPQRRIPGLLIAHAWSPHTSNRITCDHIFFYFTIPKVESWLLETR